MKQELQEAVELAAQIVRDGELEFKGTLVLAINQRWMLANALLQLSAKNQGPYEVRQESRVHGHVIDAAGDGFCTGPIANCHKVARMLNAEEQADG